jgi:transcriptional regulator with XRE-family HTH domain
LAHLKQQDQKQSGVMIVRKLRLKKGWSQSQLAEMAGVTTRTIQRIEQGNRPSMETCKALASVFEVDLSLLQPEGEQMHTETELTGAELKADEREALLYAKRMKEFYESAQYGNLQSARVCV